MNWNELNPTEKNHYIGELIKAEPLKQLYIALDSTKLLWPLASPVSDLEAVQESVQSWQKSDPQWKSWKKVSDILTDEMRGRISVVIYRWHLRYFETPGGGWVVIEALKERGLSICVQSCDDGWQVLASDDEKLHEGCAPTMVEAACLAAMEAIKPEEQQTP